MSSMLTPHPAWMHANFFAESASARGCAPSDLVLIIRHDPRPALRVEGDGQLVLRLGRAHEEDLVARLDGLVRAGDMGGALSPGPLDPSRLGVIACPARRIVVSVVAGGSGTSPTREPAYGLDSGGVSSTMCAPPRRNSKSRTTSPTETASSTRA